MSVGYRAVHMRLSRQQGRASEHPCQDCGAQAKHWSWDGTGDYLVGDSGGCVARYSLDLDRYQPRCLPCAKAADPKPWSLRLREAVA